MIFKQQKKIYCTFVHTLLINKKKMEKDIFKTPRKVDKSRIKKEENSNLDLKRTPLTPLPNTKHLNTILNTPSSTFVKNSASYKYLQKLDSKSHTIKKSIKFKKIHHAAFLDETKSKNRQSIKNDIIFIH